MLTGVRLLHAPARWLADANRSPFPALPCRWVCGFEKPQTDPSAFERPATTVLSPYLKFGCLSPRLFHSRLLLLYRAAKGAHSKPPVSLRGQLLWREFFYTVRHWCCAVLVASS